jgi:hypothetical protein
MAAHTVMKEKRKAASCVSLAAEMLLPYRLAICWMAVMTASVKISC